MRDNKQGRAVIECPQEIPCNPCVSVCKTGAITMDGLTARPEFHSEKCVGCRMCVAACPGQAIFYLIDDYDADHSAITFPYEYLPMPREGQIVTAVSRSGEPLAEAEVLAVDETTVYNKTRLVTLKIPQALKDEIRFMKRLPRED